MKSISLFSIFASVILLMLSGCGKPPSAAGGPPEGDFPVNIVGAQVEVAPLQQSILLVGSFEAPEEVTVVNKVQGEVVEITVEEGHRVKQGQLLARIDDDKIQARLLDTRARMTLAESTYTRVKELKESNSISNQEFDQALAELDRAKAALILLEEELEDTRVPAPMDGQLGEIMVSKGQIVPQGQVLMELVQVDPLEIRFEVPEQYLNVVKEGLRVDITTDVYGDDVFTGKVDFLAPRLRETTRTLLVKASVPNPDGKLKPGMFGNVKLILNEIPDALFVPESAVMQRGSSTMVMIRNAAGRSEMRPVKVGIRQGGRMHIESGLAPSDYVVAEGLIKTFPGMLLNFVEDSKRYGLDPSTVPTPVPPPKEAEAEPETQPES
jgi:membrane fusion protein (multidrug efflux system)